MQDPKVGLDQGAPLSSVGKFNDLKSLLLTGLRYTNHEDQGYLRTIGHILQLFNGDGPPSSQ